MSSLQSPTHNRSARSTPAANFGAFSPPVGSLTPEEVARPGSSPAGPVDQSLPRGSDSEPPIQPSASHEGLRSRPSSSRTAAHPAPKGHARRYSHDQDFLQHSVSVRSQRPRFRDDWDYEQSADPRDYPTMRDYDRYWRNDYRPDRYTRRGPRPPPAYLNSRRQMMMHDSDDDMYHEDTRYMKDPFETSRVRRPTDEEMGFQPDIPPHRRHSDEEGVGFDVAHLDWNNMSRKEKAQVMRIPLTQWMNSDLKNHFVATLGEFVGTTMFLFFAFAGTEVANIQSNASSEQTTTGEATGFDVSVLMYISLIFGFSLMVNVWIFFRISGGLFNPAVTLAMVLVKGVSVTRGICLFVAQMLGAMLASVVVLFLFPETFNVRTTLGGGASLVQGVFIEAILTAELVFAIFMLAKEKHRATFIAPVGIGLALFIAEMAGVQFTGGSLNPARSFGPCVVTRTFDSEHWIYWVGPFVGSLIAVVFYRFIKTLEYEMANPGADGDDANDPTKNPEKRAEIHMGQTPSIRT
ncbi:aquaporin-like protein [Ilyonectria robusta]|uniref:aquaporin-like protein n=1 Tax=Ilyonectria robusta TaxID=1079257 RepID=UPI001E8E308F|nr:aquaporin-like protein [Ilyonectria robusta]KAH8694686.1 aquaporin-like protein [Ilyonectria robusta]